MNTAQIQQKVINFLGLIDGRFRITKVTVTIDNSGNINFTIDIVGYNEIESRKIIGSMIQ